ncbi:MAG: Tat pathway signal protein [Caulobacteraceae bacterium]|nr:Tat pathway signal protein [Caulobacter sp.]
MRRRLATSAVLVAALLAGSAAAAAERKKGGGESFIALPSLNASILRSSGRHGVLSVEAGLDIPDAALRTRAEKSLPRLRDAYARFLMVYAAAIPPGGAPDPQVVGDKLQVATDQVLGRPGARVLLGTLLVN